MLSTTAPDTQEDPISVIVGATVGVVVVIITAVILICLYLKCRHRKQKQEKNLTREATTETKNTENNGCLTLKSDVTEKRLSPAATPREQICTYSVFTKSQFYIALRFPKNLLDLFHTRC